MPLVVGSSSIKGRDFLGKRDQKKYERHFATLCTKRAKIETKSTKLATRSRYTLPIIKGIVFIHETPTRK